MVETETGAVGAVEAKAQAEREGGRAGVVEDEEGHSGGGVRQWWRRSWGAYVNGTGGGGAGMASRGETAPAHHPPHQVTAHTRSPHTHSHNTKTAPHPEPTPGSIPPCTPSTVAR